MNNIQDFMNFKKEVKEDYYGILGCDRSSSMEQINAEYKIRAKVMHPDKCKDDEQALEKFKQLQIAKDVLSSSETRKKYDQWLDSGLGMSFKQWQGLRDAVHTSMHWATPRTLGRMLGVDPKPDEPLSLRTSPVIEEDPGKENVVDSSIKDGEKAEDMSLEPEEDLEEIIYEPTPYENLGLRVESPPPNFDWDRKIISTSIEIEESSAATKLNSKSMGHQDAKIAKKRQQFAQRRDSSIGTAMIMEPLDDNEMRRRFRNYEV